MPVSRLDEMVAAVTKERLVLDLSCRGRDGKYYVVTDKWQTFTDFGQESPQPSQPAPAHVSVGLPHPPVCILVSLLASRIRAALSDCGACSAMSAWSPTKLTKVVGTV